jgi:hypothetical protein
MGSDTGSTIDFLKYYMSKYVKIRKTHLVFVYILTGALFFGVSGAEGVENLDAYGRVFGEFGTVAFFRLK